LRTEVVFIMGCLRWSSARRSKDIRTTRKSNLFLFYKEKSECIVTLPLYENLVPPVSLSKRPPGVTKSNKHKPGSPLCGFYVAWMLYDPPFAVMMLDELRRLRTISCLQMFRVPIELASNAVRYIAQEYCFS